MLKKFTVIFNPVAGKGSALKKKKLIDDYFKKNAPKNYNLIETEYKGHAIKLSEEWALRPDTAVIAAGGDGTCNEVINGLMLAKLRNKTDFKPVFGVIPIGRGNDFVCGAGIPPDLYESLKILTEKKLACMDVGLIKGGDYPEGRYFGNGIGAGFDTLVGFEAAKMKHIHGGIAYFLGTLKLIFTYPESPLVEITANNTSQTIRPVLISIMNGIRMGGAFIMAPKALNNDGLFNLCMTAQGNRRSMVKSAAHYMKGTQETLFNTQLMASREFYIKALEGSLPVHADGETICTEGEEISVECIPSAIKILSRNNSCPE